MLEINSKMAGNSLRTRDGLSRRSFLSAGSLAVGGLTLAHVLRGKAAAAEAPGAISSDTAVILLWLDGGPSHIDMYDLKPNAPAEFRGEFREISTNVPGIRISEHLPMQAAMMDKFAVVRSATHTNAGHGIGSQWMLTGYQPTVDVNGNVFPSVGSVTSKLRGANTPGLPAYVNLPNKVSFGEAAYLGASYNPFAPGSDPSSDAFDVRNLKLPARVSVDRLGRRREFLTSLDTIRRDIDAHGDIVGIDKFYRDAFEMITSDKALRAFDIHREDPRLREKYGRNALGQSCLLARRLVEAGVTFVTIQIGRGWDTHINNFTELRDHLLPNYDRAVASLVGDLAARGLDKKVLLMTFGEFGRTPRINSNVGRDHWPGAMSVLYSGGGLKMGQMIGTTDSKAEYPTTKPYSPGCVLSTMYHVLKIDPKHVFHDHSNRPLPVLSEGSPIEELI